MTIDKERERAKYKAYNDTHKEQRKAHYQANKERISQRKKAYNETNKEKARQRHKAWYEANKEQVKQQSRAYRQTNREKVNAYQHNNLERFRERRREWDKNHPEVKRAYWITHNYNITIDEWNGLYERQKGLCAICSEVLIIGRKTVVDHCHDTNKVRGILCRKCNTGIGMLSDNPDTVLRAYEYLAKSREGVSHD